jgi:hypothetical protein
MIQTDSSKGDSLKEIKAREKKQKEEELKDKCEKLAHERFGPERLKNWEHTHKGIWFLPVTDDDGNIEALGILKPINRHILSYATTKIEDEGLYAFLEAAMNECWIDGDKKIIEDDEYFLPAANKFNKIIESKKATLLKR